MSSLWCHHQVWGGRSHVIFVPVFVMSSTSVGWSESCHLCTSLCDVINKCGVVRVMSSLYQSLWCHQQVWGGQSNVSFVMSSSSVGWSESCHLCTSLCDVINKCGAAWVMSSLYQSLWYHQQVWGGQIHVIFEPVFVISSTSVGWPKSCDLWASLCYFIDKCGVVGVMSSLYQSLWCHQQVWGGQIHVIFVAVFVISSTSVGWPESCHLCTSLYDIINKCGVTRVMSSLWQSLWCHHQVWGGRSNVIFVSVFVMSSSSVEWPESCHLCTSLCDVINKCGVTRVMSSLSQSLLYHQQVWGGQSHVIFEPVFVISSTSVGWPKSCHLWASLCDIIKKCGVA